MLHDLDATLGKLLEQELAGTIGGQVAISFLSPGADFPPSTVTPPALDVFLYDVREDRAGRDGDWPIVRADDGSPTGRRAPAVRVECSYLITAWPSSSSSDPARDEHRLLGEVLRALVRHPVLPADLLQGELKRQAAPLPTASLQPGRLHSIAELWQASGGRPRAAINYTVTIVVDGAAPQVVGPPVKEFVATVEVWDAS